MLRTRFNRPPITPDLLVRSRLLNDFEQNKFAPLATVIAPSGYGKSIVVSQWLEHSPDKYAWISLDAQLNDLVYYMSYLVEAVEGVFPESMPQSRRIAQSASDMTTEAITETLINELNELTERLVLVLDDYHTITNTVIHELMSLVLRNPTGNLQVVIISRRDPPIPTQELKLHNRLFSIRLKDLAFSQAELQQFLSESSIAVNKTDDLSLLHDWSEGWILGIKLFISAHAFDKKIELQKGNLTLLSQDLDSIIKQLYAQLPGDAKDLLGIASCAHQFNAELLNILFEFAGHGNNKAPLFLQHLRSNHLFLIPLDTDGDWFRFHHLFRDLVLKNWLKENDDSELLKVLTRWFAEKGYIDEAVKYAVDGEHLDEAIELIISNLTYARNSDKWYKLKNWLEQLPGHIQKNNIRLLLAQLWVQHFSWNFKGSSDIHAVLSKKIEGINDPLVLGEIYYHQSHLNLFFLSNPQRALELAEKSQELNQDTNMLGAVRLLVLALSRQMLGKGDQALAELDAIQQHYDSDHIMHLRAGLARIIVLFAAGEIIAGRDACDQLMYLIKGSEFRSNEALCCFFLGNAAFQEFDKRAIDLLSATLEYYPMLNYRAYFDAHAGLVFLLFCSGKIEAAKTALDKMKDRNAEIKGGPFEELTRSIEMRIKCLEGKQTECLEWAMEALDFDVKSTTPSFAMENSVLTRIRILIVFGNSDQRNLGSQMLEKFDAFMVKSFNKYFLIEILLLKAALHCRLGSHETAIENMQQALEAFNTQRMARPFMEMSMLIPDISNYLSEHAPFKIRSLLLQRNTKDTADEKHNAEFPNDITLREREIIQLTASGLRNKEIASQLNISVLTVKSHLSHIYSKLGVRNRTQMVRKAQSIQLLSA